MTSLPPPPPIPRVPLPDPAGLPAELAEATGWITWRAGWKFKKGRWRLDKVPCDLDGQNCSMTDPNKCGSLSQALARVERLRNANGPHYGVGLTFCAVQGVFALDLDGDLDGGPSDRLTWLTKQAPTWGETSVSGKGVHLFYRGGAEAKRTIAWRGSRLEVFGSTGFIAVTGNVLPGSPTRLADGAPLLSMIFAEAEAAEPGSVRSEARTKPADVPPAVCLAADDELLRDMFSSKKGRAIQELWEGGGPDDQSAGDLALCNHLRFFLGRPDALAIDGLFRQSKRMRPKWDERHNQKDQTYGQMTIQRSLAGNATLRRLTRPRSAEPGPRPTGTSEAATATPAGPLMGVQIILHYFRTTYRPQFRRGNCIYAAEGRDVHQAEATSTPTSALIDRLATATDAPRYESGEVKRSALPRFFTSWAKTAWGDLLAELPTEDHAMLGGDGPARDEFRRLVTAAMLTEFALGSVVRGSDQEVREVERRCVVDWCVRFAKQGPWRDIRGKRCWVKQVVDENGEVRLAIAIRHELLSQLRADRRLTEMRPVTFANRCKLYGVGSSTRKDRPHGFSAIILSPEFVENLMGTAPDDDDLGSG